MRLNNPDDIYNWTTDQLYKCFLEVTEETGNKYKAELIKVKEGIHIKIPIYYITDEIADLDYKNHEVNLPHFGTWDMKDYKIEVEAREKLMRRIIIEELEDPEPIEVA